MGIKLKQKSVHFVDQQRILKGYGKTDKEWYTEAKVSKSTLKRFRAREDISQPLFASICEAIDITDWHNHVDWQVSNHNINSQAVNQSKDIFTPSICSQGNKFTVSVSGVGILNADEIRIVNVIIDQLKALLQRFDCSFKKEEGLILTPQLEISKSKYVIYGVGVGTIASDIHHLVEAIFHTLKSLFRDVFTTNIDSIA